MIGQILAAICKGILALWWLEIIFGHSRSVSGVKISSHIKRKCLSTVLLELFEYFFDIFRRLICDSPWTDARDFAFHNRVTLHGNGIQAVESNDVSRYVKTLDLAAFWLTETLCFSPRGTTKNLGFFWSRNTVPVIMKKRMKKRKHDTHKTRVTLVREALIGPGDKNTRY